MSGAPFLNLGGGGDWRGARPLSAASRPPPPTQARPPPTRPRPATAAPSAGPLGYAERLRAAHAAPAPSSPPALPPPPLPTTAHAARARDASPSPPPAAAPAGSDADDEARRTAQRERERAARARLLAAIAAPGFDGAATVEWYAFGKVLGTGSFGEVRLAWHRLAGAQVAVKCYDKARLGAGDAGNARRVAQEVRLMERLDHPGVVRMFEAIDSAKRVLIVMELADGGNLCEYVKARGRLYEGEARRVFLQLLLAVEYLHESGVIHRDIKLENILVCRDAKGAGGVTVKLVDFGFSVFVRDPQKKLKIFCGTPSYMAPEITQRREYVGRPVDVWSLGVLLFAMLAGHFPFAGKTYPELYARIATGAPDFPDHVGAGPRDLVRRMLHPDPGKRLTVAAAKAHPWVAPALAAAGGGGGDGGAHVAAGGVALQPQPPPPGEHSARVSVEPADDLREGIIDRLVAMGFRRARVVEAVLARQRNAAATTYYLTLARVGRTAGAARKHAVAGGAAVDGGDATDAASGGGLSARNGGQAAGPAADAALVIAATRATTTSAAVGAGAPRPQSSGSLGGALGQWATAHGGGHGTALPIPVGAEPPTGGNACGGGEAALDATARLPYTAEPVPARASVRREPAVVDPAPPPAPPPGPLPIGVAAPSGIRPRSAAAAALPPPLPAALEAQRRIAAGRPSTGGGQRRVGVPPSSAAARLLRLPREAPTRGSAAASPSGASPVSATPLVGGDGLAALLLRSAAAIARVDRERPRAQPTAAPVPAPASGPSAANSRATDGAGSDGGHRHSSVATVDLPAATTRAALAGGASHGEGAYVPTAPRQAFLAPEAQRARTDAAHARVPLSAAPLATPAQPQQSAATAEARTPASPSDAAVPRVAPPVIPVGPLAVRVGAPAQLLVVGAGTAGASPPPPPPRQPMWQRPLAAARPQSSASGDARPAQGAPPRHVAALAPSAAPARTVEATSRPDRSSRGGGVGDAGAQPPAAAAVVTGGAAVLRGVRPASARRTAADDGGRSAARRVSDSPLRDEWNIVERCPAARLVGPAEGVAFSAGLAAGRTTTSGGAVRRTSMASDAAPAGRCTPLAAPALVPGTRGVAPRRA